MENSLLSRNESSAIKGLLIIFIIIGHLRGTSGMFHMFIYLFHVQCFFILPFFYPDKTLTQTNFLNLFLKILYPFLGLYIVQILISIFIFHNSYFIEQQDLIPGINNILLGLWSFVSGGMYLIDKFCGTQFLWFLPCFFSMSIIRLWFNGKVLKKTVKSFLFTFGIICFVFYSVFEYKNPFHTEEYHLISEAISPFSIFQGLGYFTLGFFVRYIINTNKIKNIKIFIWSLIFLCSASYWIFYNLIIFYFLRLVCPIIFFMAFYYSRKSLSKYIFLNNVGKHSLALYLIHPFLCIMWELLIPEYLMENIFVIILEFLVVFSISYFIAITINKYNMIRKFIFPRGEDFNLNYSK